MQAVKENLKKEEEKNEFNINPEEMLRAGLHFGHQTSKTHPKMKPYIFGVRNTVHIFDLEKTAEKLKEALSFIQRMAAENKILLFVGTKIQIKNLIKEVAQEIGSPHVSERWLGGTITNFGVIKSRIEYFKDLERKKETGELEKYTKKERLEFDQELEKLRMKFEGIKGLSKVPDAIFVVDIKKESSAVKEAKDKEIKVIGICDTNVDPTLVDYPIPANDDAISSVKYILEKVKEVISKAKSEIRNPKSETNSKSS
jgi:small subunit ribosomal protein S2